MKKPTKIILGLATLWPIVYIFLFVAFIFSTLLVPSLAGSGSSGGPPIWFICLFALHVLTMFWGIALTVFYIVNVFRNDRVPADKKVLWTLVIFIGWAVAQLIYWYLYIWREPQEVQRNV